MITLITLSNLNDAFVLRSMLEASEIPAFIPDENTCQMDWGYINAIGGIRVQVPEEFIESARTVYAQFKNNLQGDPASVVPMPSDLAVTPALPEINLEQKPERPSSGGGMWLVLLALSVVIVFVALLSRGRDQQLAQNAGDKAFEAGDLDLAIEEYNSSLQKGAQNENLYINLGNAYAARGSKNKSASDYDLAIVDLLKALQINRGQTIRRSSDEAMICNYLGNAYVCKGDYDRAITYFNQSIRLKNENESNYTGRGYAYQQKHEIDLALADYNRALEINPKNAVTCVCRGYVYADMGKYDLAISDYTRAIALDPEFSGAYNNLAYLLASCPDAQLRDGKKAVELATKACELSQWKEYFELDTLATACAEAGDFTNAVKWENKYLESPGLKQSEIADAKKRLELFQRHMPYHEEK